MALRIAVNNELDNLAAALDNVPSMLAEGGRLVALSYHSLEDRIVKDFIKREEKGLPLSARFAYMRLRSPADHARADEKTPGSRTRRDRS